MGVVSRTGSSTSGHEGGRGKASKKLLKDVLELEPVTRRDGHGEQVTRYTIRPLEEALSFDKGFYVFVRALQLLKSENEGVVLVGLGGASGSGKSAFSEKIKNFMPGVVVISMDMYNDGSKVVDQNFDDPRLTDYDTLLDNLSDLKAGRTTQVPIYDFKVSKRTGYVSTSVPPSRVVIIEGIYALNDKIRPMLDLRVSITGGVHFDLVKRVMRDIQRSGQGPEAIIQQITETVYPMYKAFIEPDLQTAQLRITNSFNPFSGFMHPTYILKSAEVPELDVIRANLKALGSVQETLDKDLADIYLLPPGEDPETCVTWLRMRNKDGRYTLMFEEWVTEEPFIISPRITFEVNVKILGGLMALGYEIGAIMKRTSHTFTVPECDVTVKVDNVENLGTFVHLLGRERQRVADLGHALGLDGTYIARSYIEQVQLDQLTSDFAAVTAEMRHRLTTTGSNTQVLSEILNASPPARIPRRLTHAARSEPDCRDALSCSAPPDAPGHMHNSHNSSHNRGPSPAQPGTVQGGPTHADNGSGGSGRTLGLLQQQLRHGSSGGGAAGTTPSQLQLQSPVPAIPTPRTQQSGFSPAPHTSKPVNNGAGSARDPPHTPQPGSRGLGPFPARPPPRSGSLSQMLAASGGNGVTNGSFHGDMSGGGSGDGSMMGGMMPFMVVEQLDRQLSRLSQTVDQLHVTDLKVQLDALVGQMSETHQALQHLTSTTAQMAAGLQQTMTAVVAQQQQPQQPQQQPAVTGWLVPVGVGAASGLLASCLVLVVGGRLLWGRPGL